MRDLMEEKSFGSPSLQLVPQAFCKSRGAATAKLQTQLLQEAPPAPHRPQEHPSGCTRGSFTWPLRILEKAMK